MIPVLLRAGARYHLRHRWQLALALLGVTLGVGVMVAVDVATASSRRAFEITTDAVSGRATHEITGGPGGIADSTYARLRRDAPDNVSIAPIIDRYVRLASHGRRVVRLLGVDPFAEGPFRTFSGGSAASFDIGALLTRRALVLERSTAAQLGLDSGDTVVVSFGTASTAALVGTLFDTDNDLARRALEDVVLADISTAQEITGTAGLDRIEVRVTGADSATALAALEAGMPTGLRILGTDARAGATAGLTRAFDTNLTALALVALVFGMFLIYNSVSFSVVQRRPLLGLLRAQGVTSRELFVQIIVEAGVLGAVATVLGLLAGSALGSLLLRLVARTINDLYFAVTVSTIRLDVMTFIKAALLGLGATILAAVPPALEALRTPPRATLARAALERQTMRRAPRLALAGVLCAAVAALLLIIPSRSITLGFTALFVLVLAGALITPAATILLMTVVRPLASRFGAVGRMATRGVTGSLSRTAPAIAALGVALSVGIAVTIMIGSFRGGVVRWLEQSLVADIYIAAPDIGANRSDARLDPRLASDVAALPGVAGVSTYRQMSLLLEHSPRSGPPGLVRGAPPDLVRMIAIAPYEPHRDAFEMLDVPHDQAWRGFDRGGVLVSEPLAWRRGLVAGDSILLPTDRGGVPFEIAAVFRDYSSEHGVIFVPRAAYETWWSDRAVTSLAVFADTPTDTDAVLARIRGLASADGIIARPNRGLREATLQVFDRTFLITGVLRLLALIVAFVGVTGALMALQLERAREIGVLRATGLTPVQVWSLITSQTALMGLSAAVLAVPLGIAMSWAMVHVINRRSFGWSFELVFGAAPFAQALLVGIGAAVLAGIYPALRMARMRPSYVLRDE